MGQAVNFVTQHSDAIGIGTTLVGGLGGAVGALREGRAAQQHAAFQANILRQNRLVANRAADDAQERGRIIAQETLRGAAQTVGRQRAGLASRGIDVGGESAAHIRADVQEFAIRDAQQILDDAAKEALFLRTRGADMELQAQITEQRGRAARSAATGRAGMTLLSASARVADKWLSFAEDEEETFLMRG